MNLVAVKTQTRNFELHSAVLVALNPAGNAMTLRQAYQVLCLESSCSCQGDPAHLKCGSGNVICQCSAM